MKNKAFTILEIIIAIAVILILAAAALQGSGGIIRSMRFNNAFNKILFITQQARNQALNGKNTEVKSYEIKFIIASVPHKVESINESLNFDAASKLTLTAEAGGATGVTKCISSANISFENVTAKTTFLCDGGGGAEYLRIRMEEKDAADNVVREKSFTLYNTSGIPQIE